MTWSRDGLLLVSCWSGLGSWREGRLGSGRLISAHPDAITSLPAISKPFFSKRTPMPHKSNVWTNNGQDEGTKQQYRRKALFYGGEIYVESEYCFISIICVVVAFLSEKLPCWRSTVNFQVLICIGFGFLRKVRWKWMCVYIYNLNIYFAKWLATTQFKRLN